MDEENHVMPDCEECREMNNGECHCGNEVPKKSSAGLIISITAIVISVITILWNIFISSHH